MRKILPVRRKRVATTVTEGVQVNTTDKICATCQFIDFNSIFYQHGRTPDESGRSYTVMRLDHLRILRTNTCRCCEFLASVARANLKNSAERPELVYYLHAYSAAKNLAPDFEIPPGYKDMPLFTFLVTEGDWTRNLVQQKLFTIIPHASSSTRYIPHIRPIGSKIDWTLAKEWLDFCSCNHDASCQAGAVISGLQVIDCQDPSTPRIMALPQDDCIYVALSYVWGDKKSLDTEPELSAENAPRIVRDAMNVVRGLGFRFLWVDRYCIPQKNDNEKHRLIRNMNEVYMGASLTIIAAAGDGPDAALPGVSQSRMSSAVDFGDFSFTPFDPASAFIVHQSAWNSRAWTYQEDVLSKRRLYFTSEGMYFRCQSTSQTEGILYPLHLGTMKSYDPKENYWYAPTIPIISLNESFGHQDFDKRVFEYHNRQLSFEEDALNAFQGVLQHFKNASGLEHLWGLPLVDLDPRSLLISLGWWCKSYLGSERRRGFPSWSWTGWTAHNCEGFLCVRNGFYRWNGHSYSGDILESMQELATISIEFRSGSHQVLHDWKTDARVIVDKAARETQPPRLRLRARVHTNPVMNISEYGSQVYFHSKTVTPQGILDRNDRSWKGGPTWEEDGRKIKLVLLYIDSTAPGRNPTHKALIVRQREGTNEEVYERLGTIDAHETPRSDGFAFSRDNCNVEEIIIE